MKDVNRFFGGAITNYQFSTSTRANLQVSCKRATKGRPYPSLSAFFSVGASLARPSVRTGSRMISAPTSLVSSHKKSHPAGWLLIISN